MPSNSSVYYSLLVLTALCATGSAPGRTAREEKKVPETFYELDYASHDQRVVLTHDLDYGAMLAATKAIGPSVVQVLSLDMTDPLGHMYLPKSRKTRTPEFCHPTMGVTLVASSST